MNNVAWSVFKASLISIAVFWLSLMSANAQEPATSEKDPRLVEAELRANIAEQEKKAAEAEQAVAVARRAKAIAVFPATETAGVDGSVSVSESAGYFAEVLAYDSLDAATETIAQDVSSAISRDLARTSGAAAQASQAVILIDDLDLSTQAVLHTFISSEIKRTIDRLEAVKSNRIIGSYTVDDNRNLFTSPPEAVGVLAALSAIPALLGTGRDIARFFQTEISISDVSVSLEDNALKSGLVSSLLTESVSIVLPHANANPLGSFASKYEELRGLRTELDDMRLVANIRAETRMTTLVTQKSAVDANLSSLENELEELKKLSAPNSDQLRRLRILSEDGGELDREKEKAVRIANSIISLQRQKSTVISVLSAAIKEADDVSSYLTTANAAGVTPFQAVGIIDTIKSNPNHYLLFADIVSHGGEIQTKKTSFSGSINYIGGAIVSYILVDQSGDLIAADNVAKVDTHRVSRRNSIAEIERQ